jgi:hypothetical protein
MINPRALSGNFFENHLQIMMDSAKINTGGWLLKCNGMTTAHQLTTARPPQFIHLECT